MNEPHIYTYDEAYAEIRDTIEKYDLSALDIMIAWHAGLKLVLDARRDGVDLVLEEKT